MAEEARLPEPAKGEGLCQTCYTNDEKLQPEALRLDSWSDYNANLDPETDYTRSTLFLGNLPYDASERQFAEWIAQRIKKLFTGEEIEYKMHGGQGVPDQIIRSGHGAPGKCFKTFAFIEFQRAEHANEMEEDIGNDDEGRGRWQGRRISVHPAVQQWWVKPPTQHQLS